MIFNVNSGAGKIPINAVPNANSSFTYDGTTKNNSNNKSSKN